jgi:hypothetical protein
MLLYDRITLDEAAQVRVTEHGYLTAMPRVARTGIQLYGGDEVGRPDLRIVRVYRPEEEVFHKDSIHSYPHKPVTNEHPPEAVTVDNWKKYASGGLGDEVLRDGDYARVPMTMMDKGLVKDYQDGKSEAKPTMRSSETSAPIILPLSMRHGAEVHFASATPKRRTK